LLSLTPNSVGLFYLMGKIKDHIVQKHFIGLGSEFPSYALKDFVEFGPGDPPSPFGEQGFNIFFVPMAWGTLLIIDTYACPRF